MKSRNVRAIRGLKQALKIWKATEKAKCLFCDKDIMPGDPYKAVLHARKEDTRRYHLDCYINRLQEEVEDYKAIRDLIETEAGEKIAGEKGTTRKKRGTRLR